MAFVHLHNHSDFSILDGATRIPDMVKRVVDFGMPALALTDHGYMFGIPNFDLECRKYNDRADDIEQWRADVAAFEKGETPAEPEADPNPCPRGKGAHAQWERDCAAWSAGQDIEQVKACKPEPVIKPIFGCEAYFITDDMIDKNSSVKQIRYHLILLAKNETGYVNLMKMMSEAANEQFYYKPRTTLDMLRRYHEGIVCQSACVQGIIPQMLFQGRDDEAEQWALTFKEIFGEDFYLEIQDHGLEDPRWNGYNDRRLSERIVKMGQKLGIKVVATNDNHYLDRGDATTEEILSSIGMAITLDEKREKRLGMQDSNPEFYIKSEEEMRQLFDWCPEAVDNTIEVANKCNYELDWTNMYLPKFPDLDEGETSEERFRKECEEGLAKRYGEDWRNVTINGINVQERFEYEYDVICTKGFADYFLIVQEYVRWAKQNGIGVGPGRGSAAGAIVAYAMDITTFDPLENGLMFERFLSVQRSEMPDIDMDFDDERRLEVVEHVRQLYGSNRVCHVITYSTIKAKQAINDSARVFGFPVWMGQKLSKMISSAPNATLKTTMNKIEGREDQYSQDFVDAYNSDADSRKIIDAALSIEGMTRGEGVHACAVLIAPTPVNDHVPTKLDTKGGVEITQYEGHSVADMGLLKMDFLGLRTLTVISKALKNIRANHGVEIDVDKIPFDDPGIYKLMGAGHTAGVFQIESAGMTATIKNMKPREYKQVVALIALYRPGPLGAGMVTDYIDRMNGKKEVVFYDDRLAPILEETYGTIVYQEQVMQISMVMCGFSAGESDSRIRKPVAKKKIKLLTSTVFDWDNGKRETTYDHWMNGAVDNGYTREIAQRIWDDVLEFASYAFNKSHSAGYAILVMQTAWLKAHYRREYMAAVLTSYMGKTEKIVHYINACRHEGIKILPPDVNESGVDFTPVSEGIRFGFAGIRGVGEGAAEAIIAEREKAGTFKNIHDFVGRVDPSQCNRRVVEALICAGAFDSLGYTRKECMWFVDKTNPQNLIDAATKRAKERANGQSSLFDMFAEEEVSGFEDEIPESTGDEWDRLLLLNREKDVLGIYVSDHPLRPYEYALAKARDFTLSDINESVEVRNPLNDAVKMVPKIKDGKTAWFAGMVGGVRKITTKTGKQMATFTLEDMEAEATVVVFPKTYTECAEILAGEVNEQTGEAEGEVFVRVKGKLERGDRGDQIAATEVQALVLNDKTNRPKTVEVMIPAHKLSQLLIENLSATFARYHGLDMVELRVERTDGTTMRMELPTRVDARNVVLLAELRDMLCGEGHVVVA